jgi:muramoyltetrapeptide carboxypeptidase
LSPGATIGVVAPASPFDKAKFEQGLAVLQDMGFKIVIPDGLFENDRYLAGSDQHRADQVNRYFRDNAIEALVCARGGFGSMRILERLDFEVIRQNPKIVVGFSDNSALLWGLYCQCGLVTLHGPTVTTLAAADVSTRDSFYDGLTSGRTQSLAVSKGAALRSGKAFGPVAGGNLTTLCHLVGTRFAPVFKKHIVLLEDRGEAPYRIDRMLSQMKLAGAFDEIAGLALGAFDACGAMSDIYAITADIFTEMAIPILAGFEVGHGQRNLTFPLGVEATLDTDKGQLAFDRPATV